MEPAAEFTHEQCLQLLSDLVNSAALDPQATSEVVDDGFTLLPTTENIQTRPSTSLGSPATSKSNKAITPPSSVDLSLYSPFVTPFLIEASREHSASSPKEGFSAPASAIDDVHDTPRESARFAWKKGQLIRLYNICEQDKLSSLKNMANVAANFGVDTYDITLWFNWKRIDFKRWAKRTWNKLDSKIANINDLSPKDQKSLTEVLYVAPKLYKDWIEGKDAQLRASIERSMETLQDDSLVGTNSKESESILQSKSDILPSEKVKNNHLAESSI